MKFFARLLILCTVEAALPSPADAADPRDPDWPQHSSSALGDGNTPGLLADLDCIDDL
jgi:hypothetical protein